MAMVLGFPWVATLFPLLDRPQGSQIHDMWGWLVSTVLSFWSHSKFKVEKWPKLIENVQGLIGRDGHSSHCTRAWESGRGAAGQQMATERRKQSQEPGSHSREMERRGLAGSHCPTEPGTHLAGKGLPSRDALSSRPSGWAFSHLHWKGSHWEAE